MSTSLTAAGISTPPIVATRGDVVSYSLADGGGTFTGTVELRASDRASGPFDKVVTETGNVSTTWKNDIYPVAYVVLICTEFPAGSDATTATISVSTDRDIPVTYVDDGITDRSGDYVMSFYESGTYINGTLEIEGNLTVGGSVSVADVVADSATYIDLNVGETGDAGTLTVIESASNAGDGYINMQGHIDAMTLALRDNNLQTGNLVTHDHMSSVNGVSTAWAAGTVATTNIYGKTGGTWTYTGAVTASGEVQGLAGAGTTATSLVKPAGDDWGTLEHTYILYITSGTSSGQKRAILANSTTAATIRAATGLAENDTFAIYDLTSRKTILNVYNCAAPIVIDTARIDTLNIYNCQNVTLQNCRLDSAVNVENCQLVTFTDCFGNGTAATSVTNCGKVVFTRFGQDAGKILIQECNSVDISSYADTVLTATGTALTIKNSGYAKVEFTANNCDETPLILSGCTFVETQGTGLTGVTGNDDLGVEMSNGGRYDLDTATATLTGANGDFAIDGTEDTWADLNTETAILVNTTLATKN